MDGLTIVKQLGLGMGLGMGSGKVSSVPGDDSIISGATTTTTQPPTTLYHDEVFWEKSANSKNLLE